MKIIKKVNETIMDSKISKIQKVYDETSNRHFLFSIIMPIYNVEKYLEEAIESIVKQDLDFKENVQLILVNDESPDDSEKICLDYLNKYPENIVYVKKENGGVSSARNTGVDFAKGKYIQFLDPDDYNSEDMLLNVKTFFEEHSNEIDLVAVPIYFFEGRKGQHVLNKKFKETRVIDVELEPKAILTHCASTFIKREIFESIKFDTKTKIGEDAKLVNLIILEKGKYGVLKEAKYFYRVRNDGSSAMQTAMNNKNWYNHSLENFSIDLIHQVLKGRPRLPLFIQYVLMQDLKWKLLVKKKADTPLSDEEYKQFFELICEVLRNLDDEVILASENVNHYVLYHALTLKYGKSFNDLVHKEYFTDDARIEYNGKNIDSLSREKITIEIIEVDEQNTIIEGFMGSLFSKDELQLYVQVNEKIYDAEDIDRSVNDIYSLDNVVKKYKGFRLTIPKKEIKDTLVFRTRVDVAEVQMGIRFYPNSGLTNNLKNAYAIKNDLVFYYNNKVLHVERKSIFNSLQKEYKYIKSLLKMKKTGPRKAAVARTAHFLSRLINKKEVWLFMDRQDKGNDNAEHLFRYSLQKNDNVERYYVIKSDSVDYERLTKEFGAKIIPYGSFKHKSLILKASKVISSHADIWVTNPFFSTKIYYRDLLTFDYVFLQHGVTMANISGWLNKYNKNIKLFITASPIERKNILAGNYNYDEKNVALTGFPRYDNLISNSKKQILIMPTWRKNLVHAKNQVLGVRPYNETFKYSEYFKRYNDLINDERLISFAKERNYEIIFFPHPDIQQQIEDFNKNEYVTFAPYNSDYQELFNSSSLMITDFSSVHFDFAYEKKPVIYYQFDYYHFERGYFDFDTMGFGDVISNHEILIDKMISYMENQCEMEAKYKDRVDSFFAYNDFNNRERVYNKIKELN